MTASIRSPADSESESRLSTTMPQPSPPTKPTAALKNGEQVPLVESMPACAKAIDASGASIRFTPPASTIEHSCRRSDSQARCTATSDEEHAVSTEIAGPCKPKL